MGFHTCLGQSLTEAVILTLMGGVLGLVLGYLLGSGIGLLLVQVPVNRVGTTRRSPAATGGDGEPQRK